MELPQYHSPEVERYANAVFAAIGRKRMEVASVLNDLSAETIAVAEELEAVSGTWNPVEMCTPANAMAERNTFIDAYRRGENYVPRFRYDGANVIDVDTSRAALLSLRSRAIALPHEFERDRLARATLFAKIDDDLATCDIAEGLQKGDDRLSKRGFANKYPGCDEELLAFAEQTYRTYVTDPPAEVPSVLSDEEKKYLRERVVTPEEQTEAFTWALKKLGIHREPDEGGDGFAVIVDEDASMLDVRDKSQRGSAVIIPTDRNEDMNAAELCALIEHEIGAHARQAVNGKRLFKLGGGALREDDETLYEGLAMRYEWEFTERNFGIVREDIDALALYVFAVDLAERGESFHGIFVDQLERRIRLALKIPTESLPEPAEMDQDAYTSCLKRAWRTTYRVMRGHADVTNTQGFAMAKDLSYLRGWLMDQELVKKGLGYANEAAIMSAKGLQALGRVSLAPDDLPVKYQPIGDEYMRMLLAQRPKTA